MVNENTWKKCIWLIIKNLSELEKQVIAKIYSNKQAHTNRDLRKEIYIICCKY